VAFLPSEKRTERIAVPDYACCHSYEAGTHARSRSIWSLSSRCVSALPNSRLAASWKLVHQTALASSRCPVQPIWSRFRSRAKKA